MNWHGFGRLAVVGALAVSAAVLIAARAPVRWVSTFAGAEVGMMDGPVRDARFFSPSGLALDLQEPARPRLYVADTYNHRIREIDLEAPGGPVTRTIAGSGGLGHSGGGTIDGPGARASFRFPRDLALDGRGRLYVCDTNNDAIRAIDLRDPAFPVTTVAGGRKGRADGPGRTAGFNSPWGIAHDGKDALYVADTYNHSVRRVDLGARGATVTTVAGGVKGYMDGAGRAARFDAPVGIAVDPRSRTVYVADSSNRCIRRFDGRLAIAAVTTLGGAPLTPSEEAYIVDIPLIYPAGIVVGPDGALYTSDQATNTIYRVAQDGSIRALAGIAGKAADFVDGAVAWARFRQPAGLAIDPTRGIFVADVASHRIRLLR